MPKFSLQVFLFFLFCTDTVEPVQQQYSPKSGVGHVLVVHIVVWWWIVHGARGYCTVHFGGDVVDRSAVVGVVSAKNESKFGGNLLS